MGGDARGNPSFRKRKGSPWTPSEGNHFRPHPPPEGGVGCGLAAFKEKRIRPGAPSARRDRKPEAAFLGESARGGLLSPERRLPLAKETCFFPPSAPRREGRTAAAFAAFKEKHIRPDALSARRDRKPEAAFLGESARGGLLSPERRSPLAKKLVPSRYLAVASADPVLSPVPPTWTVTWPGVLARTMARARPWKAWQRLEVY